MYYLKAFFHGAQHCLPFLTSALWPGLLSWFRIITYICSDGILASCPQAVVFRKLMSLKLKEILHWTFPAMSAVFQKLQHSDSLTVEKILKKWTDFLIKRHISKITLFFLVLYCYVKYPGVIWSVSAINVWFTYKSLVKITVKLIRCVDKRCHRDEIQIQNLTIGFMICT